MNVVFHSYYFQSFATLSNFNIVEDGLYSGDTRDVLAVYHIFYVNSAMITRQKRYFRGLNSFITL